jgi:hypothetical protein
MWTWSNHPGGYGKKYRWRETHCRRLTVTGLNPDKRGACTGTARWVNCIGAQTAAIGWEIHRMGDHWGIRLSFLCNEHPMVQNIAMSHDSIACTVHRRWWFNCPTCDRRCRVLYMGPGSGAFLCRLCVPRGMTYESRQAANPAKLWMKMIALVGRS